MAADDLSKGSAVTKVISGEDQDALLDAAEAVRRGAVVLTPSDTNYGILCSPFRRDAVERIYAAKKRDANKPLSLFLGNTVDWERWGKSGQNSEMISRALDELWPGPFNIIVHRRPTVPEWVTKGMGTVAMLHNRCAPLNLLVLYSGMPLAASSANISGTVSEGLVDFEMALEHVGSHADIAIQPVGEPDTTCSSTIVDASGDVPRLLRLGDIGDEVLTRLFPGIDLGEGPEAPRPEKARV